MTAPEVSLGRCARVDPGPYYGVTTAYTHDPGDYTLTSAMSGLVCTNTGATNTVLLRAPSSPALGDNYTLHRRSAYAHPFRFKPGTGHRVEGEDVDKYIELQSAGVLTVEYTSEGYWTVVRYTCVWNPEP